MHTMAITDISMIHHVGIVVILIWLLNSYNCWHPFLYLLSFLYLYQIHERYIMRLRRKLEYEGRKSANQRRILTDSETVRWLNYAVEKMWPICMEHIISQRIFIAIIPWFLHKYKPWTVKRAVVQHLYLGRTPPLFTDIRVLHDSTEDDHLVLELGLNFVTADDMSAILAAKLRKRLGFGIVAKMHLTGMHVEGKVLVGVKFLRSWPFIGRLRICFAEPPYFQMTVKPLFNHGLDVTELPGIAGWLDKLLAIAFEETLVEPNMLVVDLEKFVSPEPETWFSVDVKEPLAYANVEVIEAAELKASDLNGLSDPYVNGHLGQYRFKTQVQRKTLSPKWQEEFKVPIISWDGQNVLEIRVLDKDRFSVDDILGNCSVNLNELRDGRRHDMWLALEGVKLGRLHLSITVAETNEKGEDFSELERPVELKIGSEKPSSLQSDRAEQGPETAKPKPIADTFEAINVEGQKQTAIWVHHPGSEVSQTWEPRKGKDRLGESEVLSLDTPRSSLVNDSSSDDSKGDRKGNRGNILRRGFDKVFHRHDGEDQVKSSKIDDLSPRANVKATHIKKVGVNLVVDDNLSGPHSSDGKPGGGSSNEESGADNSGKHDIKGKAKGMFKSGRSSARRLRESFSRKGSKKNIDISDVGVPLESDSSDEDSLSSSLNDQPLTDPPKASFEIPVRESIDTVSGSKEERELPLENPQNRNLSGEQTS